MVGGRCYNRVSHRFYRHKEVKCRSGTRIISVKIGLQEGYDDDFCVNCGCLRKDIKIYNKNKKKVESVL